MSKKYARGDGPGGPDPEPVKAQDAEERKRQREAELRDLAPALPVQGGASGANNLTLNNSNPFTGSTTITGSITLTDAGRKASK